MLAVRFLRFAVSIVLSVALAVVAVAISTEERQDPRDRVSSDAIHRTAETTYPTNAAKIFRWGNAVVKDEFLGATSSQWLLNRAGVGLVRNQHGMLTLNTSPRRGSVMATLVGGDRQYGRWEARVRTRQYGATAAPYHWVFELITNGARHCGGRDIVVAESTLGSDTATTHLRNSPDADFSAARTMDLGNDVFHTYAVEVAPDHISWFIDTRVVMTERREAARAGETYRVRFRMTAPSTGTKVTSRMQMDWVRYYSLARPNARSISAPQATQGTYAGAC